MECKSESKRKGKNESERKGKRERENGASKSGLFERLEASKRDFDSAMWKVDSGISSMTHWQQDATVIILSNDLISTLK